MRQRRPGPLPRHPAAAAGLTPPRLPCSRALPFLRLLSRLPLDKQHAFRDHRCLSTVLDSLAVLLSGCQGQYRHLHCWPSSMKRICAMLLAPAKRSASALYGEVLYTGHISFPLVALLLMSPASPIKSFTASAPLPGACNKLQGLVMLAVRRCRRHWGNLHSLLSADLAVSSLDSCSARCCCLALSKLPSEEPPL